MTTVPDPFGGERMLWVLMPGGSGDREASTRNQQRIAESIERMGFMDRVQFGRQILVPYGLGTGHYPGRQAVPRDFSADQHDEIAQRMYDWTRWTDHDWYPEGKGPVFGMLNCEPRTYGPDGSIEYDWMLDKLRNGYNEADRRFLTAIIQGAKLGAPGLPLAIYNTPIVWRHAMLTDQGHANIDTCKPIMRLLDWIWGPHLYPSGDPQLDLITRDSVQGLSERIAEKYDATSAAVAGLGKPCVPFTWPHDAMTAADAANYQCGTLELCRRLPINRYGVWFDARDTDKVLVQLRGFELMRGSIERFLQ